ncbi:hypothetical protein EVAR_13092_1 [Eumeta japonica]|uniref:Uncharacterized protein n=1 Tax=Eumeta variegata TaxID=151549 RepID=A0A4C1U9F8_EUMVA|nr:hypothetical protein EVAR_13092_1 [Eumeta japonica]
MLQEQVKIEQEKGNKAIIKYDKLVVLKHNKTDADHTDNRKSLMSYGILLWGYAADIHRIFVLQKRAVRTIYKLGSRVSHKRSLRKSKS